MEVKITLDEWGYELVFQALAMFTPAKGREAPAISAFRKLSQVGRPAQEQSIPRVVLRAIAKPTECEFTDGERGAIRDALNAASWKLFAVEKREELLTLFSDAPKAQAQVN